MFQEIGSYFKVTFFKWQNTLLPELKAVYDFLRSNGEQASSQIATGLNIHQNTALKRLNKLMDANLVVKKGKGADGEVCSPGVSWCEGVRLHVRGI